MKKMKYVAILALLLVVCSCQTVTFQGIQAIKDMPDFTVIGDFRKEISDPHVIAGIFALGQPDQRIFAFIQEEIQKMSGDAAINVELAYGDNFLDFLLSPIAAVIDFRTITISGTVVKFN